MPLNNEKVGIGLQAFHDKLSVISQTGINLNYAYRIKISDRSTLGLGVQGGFLNYRATLSQLVTSSPGDPALATDVNRFLPNVGAGLFLSNDRFYFGVSCPQFLEPNLSTFQITQADSLNGARSQLRRHIFGMLGFVIGMGPNLKLKPSFLAKYVAGAPLSVDANLNLWIKDRVALGASYRTSNLKFEQLTANRPGDALIGMLELQLSDQFRLGYAHDFMLNGLSSGVVGQTHELMLRYEFGFSKGKILTPRYF
jgi:type IX secretion system PorP/SprF family membrane protein